LKTPHVIQPDNLVPELSRLEKRASSMPEDHGIVFLGCLTAMHDEERKQFNAARDRLLRIGTNIIFVESAADEDKVRLGFPDVLSLVSYDCHLCQREEQNLLAASDAPAAQQSEMWIKEAALLSGTLQEVRDVDALCWLEVSPGVRVNFSVPLTLLAGLNP